MIQALIGIKLRMKSVTNIRKITRAMEMVSLSKLNRVRAALFAERHYFARLEPVLNDLLDGAGDVGHPLLEKRSPDGKIGLCVITSDTGLCSVYNQNIIRASEAFAAKFKKEEVRIIAVGREGLHHFRRLGFEITVSCPELHGRYPGKLSEKIANDMAGIFLSKEVNEVFIAYTHFENTLRHRPRVEKFLNVERRTPASYTIDRLITEPDARGVADELIPKYLFEKLHLILLEAFTSEHAARMVAMKTATDNADELMDTLTLFRNKTRQAAITKEVIEIASAAEAMRD